MTAVVSPIALHEPISTHGLADNDSSDQPIAPASPDSQSDTSEMSAHAQAQAHRVRAATVGNPVHPVVSATSTGPPTAGGLRSPAKSISGRSVSFLDGSKVAEAEEGHVRGQSSPSKALSPNQARATTLTSGDLEPMTVGGIGGTTRGTSQMGAMASEPDLVHDVSYDHPLSPSISMPELPTSATQPAAASQVSLATSTTGGDASVSAKRQLEFERYFRDQLALAGDRVGPDDLTVVATQSADLQAKILIHGRLYLTRSYLCFRANILGFKTEKIHRIKDMVVVEKSTTAKWIQNAVSITMERTENGDPAGTEGDEADASGRTFGYGSMADRDAMYDQLAAFWKDVRPERFEQFQRKRAESAARKAAAVRDTDLDPIKEDADGDDVAAKDYAGSSGSETADEATGVKETQDSGERYKELALDAKLPVKPEALFNLIYHNDDFTMDFLKNVQKLTEVSDWQKSTEGKSRGLTYVMHMNNKIGPSKSSCIGEEVIVIEDPEKSFEIKSSTQTPDVPSGKSFKIHTRTNITHSPYKSRPGSRLYCTTQCDWSSSSWLKSTITPATISGQKEYHQKLLKAVKKWIKAHPQDFETEGGGDGGDTAGETDIEDDSQGEKVESNGNGTEGTKGENMEQGETLFDQAMAIPGNQLMMGITALCLLSLVLNWYLLSGRRSAETVIVPPPPREL